MKSISSPQRTGSLAKDAINLSDGKPPGAFLESALDLLSSQRPVWQPSAEELLELNQQKTMLSMMAAIRQGEKIVPVQLPPLPPNQTIQQEDVLRAVANIKRENVEALATKIDFSIDSEFINLDVNSASEGNKRVTLGLISRAIFAKSANAASKLQIPVACLVACINNNELSIVFHCSSNGSKTVNVDLNSVTQCQLMPMHLSLLTEQFGMDERQVRLFAATIALQAMGYNESITASMVRSISDLYTIDYEGLLRLAINIEKWRVTQSPTSFGL